MKVPCPPPFPPPPPLEVGAEKGERRSSGCAGGAGRGQACRPGPGPERSLLQGTLKATETVLRAGICPLWTLLPLCSPVMMKRCGKGLLSNTSCECCQ